MSYSVSIQTLKALPSLSFPRHSRISTLVITSQQRLHHNSKENEKYEKYTTGVRSLLESCSKKLQSSILKKSNVAAAQAGLLLATVTDPALAVTGVNDEPDLIWVAIKIGIIAFGYFLIVPPIVMNWMRIRWYKRGLLEMYFQFMFVFIFFPGMLLWAPFLNFRKFPSDPSMKYPWSKPENPDQIKGGFLRYPWASVKDYEVK